MLFQRTCYLVATLFDPIPLSRPSISYRYPTTPMRSYYSMALDLRS